MTQRNSLKRLKSEMKDFHQAFDTLPRNQTVNVRKELMEKCGWSVSAFYYKKRGDTPIWDSETQVIEEVFSRFKIDPWTGTSIN